jgi:uncharacterized membrane protein
MALSKPTTSSKPALSTADYVQGRIDKAAESGFNSTKIWLKNENLAEAKNILEQADFSFTTANKDDKSTQLEVSW